LAAYIRDTITGMEITMEQFNDNRWLEQVQPLCRLESGRAGRENGARAAARFLAGLLDGGQV
jgi:hypothetical protein